MRVRLTKYALATKAEHPSARFTEYRPGEFNAGVSVPVDFWVEGYLLAPLKVGEQVVMRRDTRNGVKVDGIFTSSEVMRVTPDGFQTLNSIYRIRPA